MEKNLQLPDLESGRLNTAVAKIAVSVIPGIGGAMAEIVGLIGESVDGRQVQWMRAVTDAINQIRSRTALSVDELLKDESFVSFVLCATSVALRNHQEKKISALKHSMISVGISAHFKGDLEFQFLRYVDELTVSHFEILQKIAERHARLGEIKTMRQVIEFLRGDSASALEAAVTRSYVLDLDARGLVRAGDLEDLEVFESKATYVVAEQSDRHPLIVTDLGNLFLSFIKSSDISDWREYVDNGLK